ncbi:MAG: hypothetical protein PG981_000614 [Wolbachia endosymbiont of Ctenocephalides orientis wCori]|nr:MAG: hypothetical protein PG981_000614 [Wolbachia endosymbiont of Ctenocephalides orientis wCori]
MLIKKGKKRDLRCQRNIENGNTNSPKVGKPIDAPKEFKHKVKMSGIIHTSTRRNNVGDGLNEVPRNVTKKTNSFTPIQRTDSTSSFSSIEDASLDTSAHNVNGRKKVTFADPRESVATGPEVKQQLPETQRIIDNAEKLSDLLNASKSTVPFIPKERNDSDVSSWSTSSVDSQQASSNQAEIDRMMRKNIEEF